MHQMTNVQTVIAETKETVRKSEIDLREAETLFNKLKAEGLAKPDTEKSLALIRRKLESLKRITQ